MSPSWCGGWTGACRQIAWEAIFVDDNSPDGTAAAVKAIAAQDPRVRCLQPGGTAGPGGGLHRGHALQRRPLCGGDRCRPAA